MLKFHFLELKFKKIILKKLYKNYISISTKFLNILNFVHVTMYKVRVAIYSIRHISIGVILKKVNNNLTVSPSSVLVIPQLR